MNVRFTYDCPKGNESVCEGLTPDSSVTVTAHLEVREITVSKGEIPQSFTSTANKKFTR